MGLTTITTWLRHTGITTLLIPLLAACTDQVTDMNAVVFNYRHQPLADVYVNNQHIGAGFSSHFRDGGTGGSIVCCVPIKPGDIQIKWMIGGGPADANVGKVMTTTVQLDSIKPNAKYLGVYLYEDGTVALDTAVGIPEGKPGH